MITVYQIGIQVLVSQKSPTIYQTGVNVLVNQQSSTVYQCGFNVLVDQKSPTIYTVGNRIVYGLYNKFEASNIYTVGIQILSDKTTEASRALTVSGVQS